MPISLASITSVLICGLGRSGIAAAKLALKHKLTCYLSDENPDSLNSDQVNALLKDGAHFIDFKEQTNITPIDLAILSPGIPPSSQLYQKCQQITKELCGELDFAALFMPNTKLLGITGTNGKTTCTEMCTHILQQSGLSAIAAGNIGLPLAEVALTLPHPEVVVLELSSFQLDLATSLQLEAGVLLNIDEDHRDRYPQFQQYIDSKFSISKISGYFSFFDGIEEKPSEALTSTSSIFSTQTKEVNLCIIQNELYVEGKSACTLPSFNFSGKHNLQNLLAAITLCGYCSIDAKDAVLKMQNFETAPHRMQTILQRSEISYINDSKATNPASLAAAIESLSHKPKKIVLIAGGRDKNMDLSTIIPLLYKYVKEIYTYGECGTKLCALWNSAAPCEFASSFDEAVQKACLSATKGDCVLLSPGCASLDLFSSYVERGKQFEQLVHRTAK